MSFSLNVKKFSFHQTTDFAGDDAEFASFNKKIQSFSPICFYLKKMNQSNRDMNSFLAEQAMLLANNSVSLTQITRPVSLATSNNNSKQQQTFQNLNSSSVSNLANHSPTPGSSSSLSKYSQLLLVLEEMGKDIR